MSGGGVRTQHSQAGGGRHGAQVVGGLTGVGAVVLRGGARDPQSRLTGIATATTSRVSSPSSSTLETAWKQFLYTRL